MIVVWIDKNVDNYENNDYQKKLLNIPTVNLICFQSVDKGINYLKTIEYERTIIITSGSIYSEFYEKFKDNINYFQIAPRIIIFTFNRKRFIEKNNKLPINHPFYNAGGVVDNFNPVKEFILSKNEFSDDIIEMETLEREKEDKFNFELITEKNQLILPLFFPDYIKEPSEEGIQYFNKYMLRHFKENCIYNLFSQLVEVKEIPIPILTKFWVRSYTAESEFYKKMNKDLLQNDIKNYLIFIQMLYEAVKKNYLKPQCNKKLYRGTLLSKKEFEKIINYMDKKIEELPAAIVYGRSFFSFSDNIKVAQNFKERKKVYMNKKTEMVGLFVIEQCPQNDKMCSGNASIQEYSFYKNESEILFFPFSSFEIKKIKKINENEFIITLNYLGKYQNLFENEDSRDILERVPKTSKIAKYIFSANIIDPTLKIPNWAKGLVIGFTIGAAIGTVACPGAGTIIGGVVGGVIGKNIGLAIGDDD